MDIKTALKQYRAMQRELKELEGMENIYFTGIYKQYRKQLQHAISACDSYIEAAKSKPEMHDILYMRFVSGAEWGSIVRVFYGGYAADDTPRTRVCRYLEKHPQEIRIKDYGDLMRGM